MYLTYDEYAGYGYNAVPAKDFKRFEEMAGRTVSRYCPGKLEGDSLSDVNKRGLCEIADMLYVDKTQAGMALSGFSNDGYSEQYVYGDGVTKSVIERVSEVIGSYFDKNQLFRGV